jgi:RNA polymerase sigma-70 factor (ECF subfamily)
MDELYIRKVLEGDPEAFRYFLKTYKDMAFHVAVSIVKDSYYAEEVVQDAFMKAFKGLRSFNGTAKFKTWFYRIVVNEAFQRLRKTKKEIVSFVPGEEIIRLEDTPLYDLQEEEQKHMIGEALNRLPPKESLVLALFYLEDYSLADICNITGWSLSNTKIILHRARKDIRSLLGSISKISH